MGGHHRHSLGTVVACRCFEHKERKDDGDGESCTCSVHVLSSTKGMCGFNFGDLSGG